jgi:hypothetical protein
MAEWDRGEVLMSTHLVQALEANAVWPDRVHRTHAHVSARPHA